MRRQEGEGLFRVGLFFLFLVFWPLNVTAGDAPIVQEGDNRADLVFTYTRESTPRENVAADVTVITQEEIKKIPASNAAEVIQYVPGVYVEFSGGLGSQASASILGSSTRQVAVYQDGVPLNLLGNPTTDLSSIPIADIDRIEIYKGAASAVWGSALGGVINIITKEPDLSKPFSGQVQSSYGQFGTTRNSGTVSGGIDRFGYLVSLAHDQTDGFVPHISTLENAAYTKLNGYVGNGSRLSFVYSTNDDQHESPASLLYGAPYWEDIRERRSYERLLFDTPLSDSLTWTIEGRYSEDDISDQYRCSPPQPGGFDYFQSQWGISTRMRHEIPGRNHLVLGFDGDWGHYDYSMWSGRFDSGNWAAYVNDTLDLRPFSLTAGIRYDNNLDFGSEVSPMGGAVYHFSKLGGLIRAQVAKGFSAPPGAWLHAPVEKGGNPDLKAERGINTLIGGELKPLPFLTLEGNLFQSEIDNLIDYDSEARQMRNIAEATRRGIEGRIGTLFTSGVASGLSLSFGASFVDVRDGATGEVIRDFPRNLYDVSVAYTYKNVTNSLTGRYVFNNSLDPQTHDEVFVFDYLVKVKLPSLCQAYTPSLFLAVHDLTNAGYVYHTYWPQPGRWAEGGVKLEF